MQRGSVFLAVAVFLAPGIDSVPRQTPEVHAVAAACAKPAAAALRLSGYLPDYEFAKFDPAVVGKLDELIYFSIEPRPDGQLDTSRAPPAVLAKLREIRGRQATKLWIAVGGGNRSQGFSTMALDPISRRRFINDLRQFCIDHGFAGADFDWEFPAGKVEQAAYNALLLECKRQFAPRDLAVSVAIVTSQRFPPEVQTAVDQFRLMSYDHDGPEHASLVQARADIATLVQRGIRRQKISLGVPFYGRTPDAKALAWKQIVARFHPARGSDTAGGYSFNGPATIESKARLAKDEKLGGLMIWELGQDLPPGDPDSLLTAAVKALR